MIRSDYILRQIDLFGVFLRKILLKIDAGELPAAESEIATSCQQFTGMDYPMLRSLPLDQIENLLSASGTLETEKIFILGSLFGQEGNLASAEANEVRAFESRIKGLELMLLCAAKADHDGLKGQAHETIEAFLRALSGYDLPAHLCHSLAIHFCDVREFSQADDWLHEGLDSAVGATTVQEGIRLYQEMLKHSDEELVQGGLPRQEIQEAIDELRST